MCSRELQCNTKCKPRSAGFIISTVQNLEQVRPIELLNLFVHFRLRPYLMKRQGDARPLRRICNSAVLKSQISNLKSDFVRVSFDC